jgi:hypothetical protein
LPTFLKLRRLQRITSSVEAKFGKYSRVNPVGLELCAKNPRKSRIWMKDPESKIEMFEASRNHSAKPKRMVVGLKGTLLHKHKVTFGYLNLFHVCISKQTWGFLVLFTVFLPHIPLTAGSSEWPHFERVEIAQSKLACSKMSSDGGHGCDLWQAARVGSYCEPYQPQPFNHNQP